MVIRTVNDYDESLGDITADSGRMYCCGVAELYGVHSNSAEKIEAAKMKARFGLYVGLLIATTNENQAEARANLKKAGFSVLTKVKNPRMDFGVVTVWGCDISGLKDDGKRYEWRNKVSAASAQTGGAKNVTTEAPAELRMIRGNVWVP